VSEFVDPFEAEEEPARKGPKRRPGPNDEAIAGEPPSPTLGEGFTEELEAMQAEQAESLPPLMRASDLLPKQEDPLEGIPQEPPDEETPPDEVLPTFLVRRNRYGPGVHSVLFADGTPVGVWLDRERHDADPAAVHAELTALGLEEDLALQFADRRAQRMEADASLAANPAVQRASGEETRRKSEKELVQKAFLEAHKKKQK
jgi:hypothetical protein